MGGGVDERSVNGESASREIGGIGGWLWGSEAGGLRGVVPLAQGQQERETPERSRV